MVVENRVKRLRVSLDTVLAVFDYMGNRKNRVIQWPSHFNLPLDTRVLRIWGGCHDCLVLLIASEQFEPVDERDVVPLFDGVMTEFEIVSIEQSDDLLIIEAMILSALKHGQEIGELEHSSSAMLSAFRRLRQAWNDGKMPVISKALADYFRCSPVEQSERS